MTENGEYTINAAEEGGFDGMSKVNIGVNVTQDMSDYYTKEETNELLNEKQDSLIIDQNVVEDSTNPVASGGVYNALREKADESVFSVEKIAEGTEDEEDYVNIGKNLSNCQVSIGDASATGDGSFAIGSTENGGDIQAQNIGAFAAGFASGSGATIRASGEGSFVHGTAPNEGDELKATGEASSAMGVGVICETNGGLAIGKYNTAEGGLILRSEMVKIKTILLMLLQ